MNVFIFANCQGSVLQHFLPSSFSIHHRNNYCYINETQLDTDIQELLTTCDYFIYQPLSSIYPVYNTDNLKTYIKSTCKTISFPYIFNNAFTPIFKSFKRDIAIKGEYVRNGGDDITYENATPILELKERGYTLPDILNKYDANEIDFRYKERFDNTIAILKNKEIETDVKVSQFIIDNHKKYRLFNYHNFIDLDCTFASHPSNILINEYANQILKLMELNQVHYEGDELLIATTLVSRYDINYYNYEWVNTESESINDIIKKIISEIYMKF